MKYVIVAGAYPILFSSIFSHANFRGHGDVTSAGFVEINKKGEVKVFGGSEMLNIHSNPLDAKIIHQSLKS